MMVALFVLLGIYVVTIAQLSYGYRKVSDFAPTDGQPQTFFSIVVPFRDEAGNLPLLLESIQQLDYPIDCFELILINDFSADNSERIVYDWRMRNGSYDVTLLENIKVSGSPKKDAIARAIPIVKQDWIITTDADCRLPRNWLRTFDAYIRQHPAAMVCGAVSLEEGNSFLRQFQQLDLVSLQGATIGSFGLGLGFMCNGANFAYTKKLFHDLGGFAGNTHTASGDDVFLLQKAIARFPDRVRYLKSETAIVTSKPETSWTRLFQQRVRWASKTAGYQSIFGKDLALIVFFGNLSVLLAAVGFATNRLSGLFLIILFGAKFMTDSVLILQTDRFLKGKAMGMLLPASILYPFFSVFVAVWSLVFGYVWKGRKY